MEFLPLKELLKERKKLAKQLEPLPFTGWWDADDERDRQESTRRELAEIDAQIAERTGKAHRADNEAG